MSILKVIDSILKELLGKLHNILNDPRRTDWSLSIVIQNRCMFICCDTEQVYSYLLLYRTSVSLPTVI